MSALEQETPALGLHSLEDYSRLVGEATVARLREKVTRLSDRHIVHVSSTLYGGGVAELLTPLTLLMNESGLKTGWRTIQGTPEFFALTKEIHNGLQGEDVALTPEAMALYEQIALENATRMHFEEHDAIIVHDPQPLALIRHLPADALRVWQCHIDLTTPNRALWHALQPLVESYDTAVFSLPEFAQRLRVPQRFIMPAINPFSSKNREMSEEEIDERLAAYGIPRDLPIVMQASRFDKWKDPRGVIEAVRLVQKEVPCTLVLVGNGATDDPEGEELFRAVEHECGAHIIAILADDAELVNALQRSAAVVLQKSLREGFGLTVTEAMWKGACVIGGNVGGIRHQIVDGENGFLVDDVPAAADRILTALRSPELRAALGARAQETVRSRFLLVRLMEDWLDVIAEGLAARSANG